MMFPLSLLGYILEKIYLRLYKKIPSFVVSLSTQKNLERYGFSDIFVMRDCIDNSLIYVGRLKKSKRVHDIIRAFSIVHEEIPSSRLNIVGRGDKGYEKYLYRLVDELGLGRYVRFHGYLSKEERNELMGKSEAIMVASVKEGWGLIVVEANAHGTPAIAYDVDGLRDSVKDGKTGLITKESPEALAESIVSFLRNTALKMELSNNALEYAKGFNWDESAEDVLRFLQSL